MDIAFPPVNATRTGLRPSVPHSQATPDTDVDLAATRLAQYDARLARIHQRVMREAAAAAGAARLSSGYWRRRVTSPKKKASAITPGSSAAMSLVNKAASREQSRSVLDEEPPAKNEKHAEWRPSKKAPAPAPALPSISELVAALKLRQQEQQAVSFTSTLHDLLHPATAAVDSQLNSGVRPLPKRISKQVTSVNREPEPTPLSSASRSSSILPDPFVLLDLNDVVVASNPPQQTPKPAPPARRVVFISNPERDSPDSNTPPPVPPPAPTVIFPPPSALLTQKPKRAQKPPRPATSSSGLVEIFNKDSRQPIAPPQRVIVRTIPDEPTNAKQLALPAAMVESIKQAKDVRRSFLREHFGTSPKRFHRLVEEATDNIFNRILTSSLLELDRTLCSMAESVFHSEFA